MDIIIQAVVVKASAILAHSIHLAVLVVLTAVALVEVAVLAEVQAGLPLSL